jgi:Xaa-Pro aminopeptidase
MRKRGCMVSFDTIMAFGANGSRNHHRPGGRKLRKKDTILIDFGETSIIR